MRKFNIRSPYTFAYFVESMQVGSASLLFYLRKDSSLHYQYTAHLFESDLNEGDKESVIPISDDLASQLERVFGLMIDAYNIYTAKREHWSIVNDGGECVLICGKKRVRFNDAGVDFPLLDDFRRMINQLSDLVLSGDEKELNQLYMSLQKIVATLETYISCSSHSDVSE